MRSDGTAMDNNEAERPYRQADTTEERSFDEMAKGFAGGPTSREQVLKGLVSTLLGGGLLALLPGAAGAKAHQSSGSSAVTGGDGRRRRKHHNGGDGRRRRKHHRGGDRGRGDGGGGAGSGGDGSGGAGSGVCPPTCPGGTLTVAPTAQGECRCVPVSPGLQDPAFACGGR